MRSGLFAAAVLAGGLSVLAAPPSDEDLWKGAPDRIDRYRKADLLVTVTDAQGRPLSNAKVTIEQTRHAFLFGCNIFLWGRCETPEAERQYRHRFADLFNYATLPFYWASYERKKGQPRHERTRQVAQWCREHGITPKGHPLAWNYDDPPWLPGDVETIRRLQMERIDDCVARFRGLIDIWDVVNEATHFDRDSFWKRAPKMTRMWQEVGRVEFTRQCFQHARRANPQATLLINDYRVDEAYEKLIDQLRDEKGRPLFDVIGIQSHMHGGPWPNGKIWDVCERFSRFGVPLHFTETTILSGRRIRRGSGQHKRGEAWPTTPDGEQWQKREVERFYTMLFSHPAVEAITWWDFSDWAAWQGAPAGFLRKDMSPKPAYRRLQELIKKEWWTGPTTQLTGSDGRVRFRAFLGDYEVQVVTPDGRRHQQTFRLPQRGEHSLRISIR
ncbi:MAG: 1,4-beta-xylanase [Planctomycetes bacterium]|nr:1,4-beta-xylanase [Planctomycetota bacterium]